MELFILYYVFFGYDYTCDEKTLLTNLNHVCEIVVEKVPMIELRVLTKWGRILPHMQCPRDAKPINDKLCEKKSFILKYETVVEYESPTPWAMPTKFGMFRHDGWYTCRYGWKLNSENKCEYSFQRRITKK